MPRIAAVDFGLKRIGLAVSDESGRIALPLKMIPAGKSFKESSQNVLSALSSFENDLEAIVVGMPLLLNGRHGEMADLAMRFAETLKRESRFRVETVDERLSTAQAERALKEMSYSRKKRAQIVDSASAALVLQTYLEKHQERL